MSLFKKMFGSEKSKNTTKIDHSKFDTLKKPDFNSLQELFEQNAGLSFEKQRIFADVIEDKQGKNKWDFNMDNGTISFGKFQFPIQIIGSLSFNNNSWMWGWANTQSNIPENLLMQSNKLKEIGEQKNIKELKEGHFNVEQGFEHKIGMMACGFFKTKGYYCANYGQGTLVVTIDDNTIPEIDKNRLEKVLTSFSELISRIELNHKNTFKNYLIDRGFKIYESENKIEGLINDKIFIGEFDELGKAISLNGKM